MGEVDPSHAVKRIVRVGGPGIARQRSSKPPGDNAEQVPTLRDRRCFGKDPRHLQPSSGESGTGNCAHDQLPKQACIWRTKKGFESRRGQYVAS